MGMVHEEINLSLPSGIIHGHLIVLVRHKQIQMCLKSDPKCYERISMKFLKYFVLVNFLLPYSLTHSLTLPYSFTHSLMHSVKRSGKLATATATASLL